MLAFGSTDQDAPAADPTPDDDTSFAELIGVLTSLLANLSGAGPCTEGGIDPADRAADAWEDESYGYHEVTLPVRWQSSEIDVSVSNGRAFIRIAR